MGHKRLHVSQRMKFIINRNEYTGTSSEALDRGRDANWDGAAPASLTNAGRVPFVHFFIGLL
jgi:hypothetical protein